MHNILVTGSSGWLGRFLVPMLRQKGWRTFGLDIAPGSGTDALGSIGDRALVDTLFAKHRFDAVVHAGALHKPDIARYPKHAFIDANVAGTVNLLEAAAATGVARFVFTSTTSLMISQVIRDESADTAVWLDERSGPLQPRNIYGVTKRAGEELCRLMHGDTGLPVVILRTARFFPEEDDTLRDLSGENLKANEFLHRRLTVEDAAAAHVRALERAPAIGFGIFVISAPPPFAREELPLLKRDPVSAILRHFPDAAEVYARRGWSLPASIGRVYDPGLAERELGFRCSTDFSAVLDAVRSGRSLPFTHDASYLSPHQIS